MSFNQDTTGVNIYNLNGATVKADIDLLNVNDIFNVSNPLKGAIRNWKT